MNIRILLGLAIVFGVFIFSLITAGDNPSRFLDIHGFVIVIGGTFGASALAYGLDRTFKLFRIALLRTLKEQAIDYKGTIKTLMDLDEVFRNNKAEVKAKLEQVKDPFIKEAVGVTLESAMPDDEIEEMLWSRVNSMALRYTNDANIFTSIGKYPPAMGLLGAVMGMVMLLATVGQEGAESQIGPALSVALVATFYGIALANLIIIPIGENMAQGAKELKIKNAMIVEGAMLIKSGTNPIILADKLNSFLLPSERLDATVAKNFKSRRRRGNAA